MAPRNSLKSARKALFEPSFLSSFLFLPTMKKALLLFLALGFAAPAVTHAYDEARKDEKQPAGFDYSVYQAPNTEKPSYWKVRTNSENALNRAIQERQKRYLKTHFVENIKGENGNYKSKINALSRHNISRYQANVNQRSTKLRRTGIYQDVPYYDLRRERSNSSLTYGGTNATKNFRARALDYYVGGGDAGAEAIKSGVVFGSTHRVPRYLRRTKQYEVSLILDPLRDQQRFIGRNPIDTPTGYQKTTYRTGDSSRNYAHPFSKQFLDAKRAFQNAGQSTEGFFSTEAE
jgi:hypothetical protein